MRSVIDRDKVNARAAAANYASVGGLMLLLASVLVPLFVPGLASFSWMLSVAGAAIAMIGIYLANRWVRKPRPEESLDKALKSFDDHFQIFHYPALPCDHILLTPSGVVALEVVNLAGRFAYRDGRWKESMSIGRALRYIVEPRLTDPTIFSRIAAQELADRFQQALGADNAVPIKALMVFTHPAAELELDGPSVPACRIEKLRKQISIGAARLAPDIYERMSSFLRAATVP